MLSSSFPTAFTKGKKKEERRFLSPSQLPLQKKRKEKGALKKAPFLLAFSGIYFCSSLCRWTVWVGKAKEAPSSSTIFIMP